MWNMKLSSIPLFSMHGADVPSQLKTFEKWKEKWKWNFGSLLTPQLAAGSESERKYLLLLWWKVQKSAMKMWAVATPHSRWTTWICLPTSCGCCQGDLGEDGLDLHFFWHAGDHHWNPILFPLFQLSRPHYQEFWAQQIKTYHQIDESNPILLASSWPYATNVTTNTLLKKTWGLTEKFYYKCHQCNFECIFVGSLRNHKKINF